MDIGLEEVKVKSQGTKLRRKGVREKKEEEVSGEEVFLIFHSEKCFRRETLRVWVLEV